MQKIVYSVGLYDVDRCYGGPEEGGWWYDAGILVFNRNKMPRVYFFNTEDEAIEFSHKWQTKLNSLINSHKPYYCNTNGEGEYRSKVFEYFPPLNFPENTPHYE